MWDVSADVWVVMWVDLFVPCLVIQGSYINSSLSPDSMKAEVVGYARLHWPIYFSKFFEASVISGESILAS